MLDRRPFGRTGLLVPRLGWGTVPLGSPTLAPDAARALVHGVLDAGIVLVDTAAAYDDAEEALGRHLGARRDEVVLVTKTGLDRGYVDAWSRKDLDRLFERSLKRLRTDHVDVLLLHSCDLDVLEQGEALEALEAWKQRGAARAIGYSGDGEALGFAIRSGRIDAVEISYSLLDQANRPWLVEAAGRGLGVLLKRALANAVPGRTSPPASAYAAEYWPRWTELALAPADVDGLPWMEAGLRFAAFAAGVSCAIVGSGSLAHMQAHVAALEKGPLPASTVSRLEQRFDRAAAGRWPGLT